MTRMSEVARRLGLLVVFILIALPYFTHAQVVVNINTADKATLMTLSGLGGTGVKAQAVIDYRNAHGPFSKIEDIMNVSGIGTATFNNIKNSITVGDVSQTQTDSQTQQTQETSQASTSTAQTQTTVSQAAVSSYVAPPVPQIFVDAGGDRTVIVGADAEFDARAYDRTRNVLDTAHVRFLWNFGDGTTSEGPAVLHHFEYPGRYAVVVDIAEDKSAGSDTVIVTAEPAKLAWKALPDGGVELNNLAGRDLDLSGWIVRAGPGVFASLFRLPPHSVILAGSSMRIARATLGFTAAAEVELQYPNGVAVVPAGETTAPASSAPPATSPPSPAPAVRADPVPASDPPADNPESSASFETEAREDTGTSAQVAAAASAWGGPLWWLGALGVALAAGGAVFVAKRFGKHEWNIVEEG